MLDRIRPGFPTSSPFLLPALCALVLSAFAAGGTALAQENGDCYDCHAEKDFTAKRHGKTVSMYVDDAVYKKSVHGDKSCVDCHTDLAGQELPHPDNLKRVQCGECHEHADEQKVFSESLHGQRVAEGDLFAASCQDCHGHHDIRPASDPTSVYSRMNVPLMCGRCHKEGSPAMTARDIPEGHQVEGYSQTIHGAGFFESGLIVTAMCTDCHTAHHVLPHTDPRSTIHVNKVTATCTKCHARIEQVHRKVIKGELWEKEPHLIPTCVDCHEPHKERRVFYDQGMADKDCMRCHGDRNLSADRGGTRVSLFVDKDVLVASVHGKTACAKCHTGGDPTKVRICETIQKTVDCSICHADLVDQYRGSTHGGLAAEGDPNGPTCKDCHGTHQMKGKKDPLSPTFPRNVPTLCALCHREGGRAAARYKGVEHEIVKHYTMSIHGKGLLESGLVVTAMCTDCHTAHGELPATNPASTVHDANIAATCARCHFGINEIYQNSVHSPKFTQTDKPLPSCKVCHTSHTIRRADQDDFKLGIMTQCGQCHEEIAETYFDTYHGKVSKLGYSKTAKCYDCHGAHDVLPPTNPASRLSHDNVVETCGACHPGAHRQFAGYLSHATHHDPVKYPVLFYVFWSMTGLLIGTLTFFGIHTIAWLPRSLQMRRKHIKIAEDPKALQYMRFTPFDRIMHITMLVSFFALVISGMVLKFSYADWARALAYFLGGFEGAGLIHRIGAVVTFGYFAVHLFDLVRRKFVSRTPIFRFVFGPDTLLPTKRDLFEFIGTFKWFFGLGPQPKYGRWTYWEKFDYCAIFWGVPVIGLSGLMLWFPELFTRFLPGWFINVATIVHSDEALLATSFIFTIHFFNTHFRPQKFPMDMVIFTGRVPLEEFKEERPDEYRALEESGKLKDRLVEPVSKTARVLSVGFGGFALIVGLTLIVLILYSMIFTYQ